MTGGKSKTMGSIAAGCIVALWAKAVGFSDELSILTEVTGSSGGLSSIGAGVPRSPACGGAPSGDALRAGAGLPGAGLPGDDALEVFCVAASTAASLFSGVPPSVWFYA